MIFPCALLPLLSVISVSFVLSVLILGFSFHA